MLIAFAAVASSSLAVLLVTTLSTATLLDARAMLRGDKLVDRGDRKAGIEPWLHAQLSKVASVLLHNSCMYVVVPTHLATRWYGCRCQGPTHTLLNNNPW